VPLLPLWDVMVCCRSMLLRWGWVVNATHRPHYPPGKRPGTQCIGGWVDPRPVCTGAENIASIGIRSPDHQARSDSPCRLELSRPTHEPSHDWRKVASVVSHQSQENVPCSEQRVLVTLTSAYSSTKLALGGRNPRSVVSTCGNEVLGWAVRMQHVCRPHVIWWLWCEQFYR
jgi:hypothetical protein